MLNNALIIVKYENIRKYKKKMKVKLINFEMLINLFYDFSLKKSINENINNLKSKRSFLNFNNDLTKTFKKIFRDFFNDFDETLFFKNSFEKDITTRIAFQR